ncbi:hypothetical protein Tco_0774003 [Tanacetum coccineum]|uniref:Uncharacterized protein n=1 Tax=Tanacetum coccineum TaxID=301880 RepID=A0ABQ4ZNC1_9ASTR
MVAYLEKTDGNAEFHEIIDFLTRSSIHYALTVIAGKPVSISEASIRSDLQFNDVARIDVSTFQAIFGFQLLDVSVSMKKRLARKKSLKKKLIQKEHTWRLRMLKLRGGQALNTMELSLLEICSALKRRKVKKEKGVGNEDSVSSWLNQMSSTHTSIKNLVLTETIAQGLIPMESEQGETKGKKKNEFRSKILKILIDQELQLKEDESDTKSEGITEAKKKFKMLANDEEIAKKVQTRNEAEPRIRKQG